VENGIVFLRFTVSELPVCHPEKVSHLHLKPVVLPLTRPPIGGLASRGPWDASQTWAFFPVSPSRCYGQSELA
jgi:hypothetical protein